MFGIQNTIRSNRGAAGVESEQRSLDTSWNGGSDVMAAVVRVNMYTKTWNVKVKANKVDIHTGSLDWRRA